MAAVLRTSSSIYKSKEASNRILLLEVRASDGFKEYKELTMREWFHEITHTVEKELIHSPATDVGIAIKANKKDSIHVADVNHTNVAKDEPSPEQEFSVSEKFGNAISALEGIELRTPNLISTGTSNTNESNPYISDENYRVPNIPSSTSLPSLAALVDDVPITTGTTALAGNTDALSTQSVYRRRRSIPKTEAKESRNHYHFHQFHNQPPPQPKPLREGFTTRNRSGSTRMLNEPFEPSTESYHVGSELPYEGVGMDGADRTEGDERNAEGIQQPPRAHVHHATVYHEHDPLGGDDAASSALPLRIRDLRRLDFSANANEEIAVQVRRHVVLFSADPMRAVVTASKLWIVVPPGADSLLKHVDSYLQDWFNAASAHPSDDGTKILPNVTEALLQTATTVDHPTPSPHLHHTSEDIRQISHPRVVEHSFEMHCYETILSTTTMVLEDQSIALVQKGQKMLKLLKQKRLLLTYDAQANISSVKTALSGLIIKVRKYRKLLDEVLDDEETTALMNLNLLSQKPSLYKFPLSDEILIRHEEVEQALESYLTDLANIESNMEVVASQLVGFEKQAAVRLDSSQNRLLMFNIVLMIFICFSVLGSWIAGAFAMNLNNSDQIGPVPHVFTIVFVGTSGLIFIGTYSVYKMLVYLKFVTVEDPVKERLLKSM